MRFREDKPADLDRARAAVTEWRKQHPAGTDDQLTAALGPQFHPGYGPVLRAVLFTLDRATPAPSQEPPGRAGEPGREPASPLTGRFPYPVSRPRPQPRKAAPDMTTGPGHPPRPAPRDHDQARQYLAAIAAILTIEGIPCRLTPEGRPPTLTIEEPGSAPNPVTVVIDPGNGPGFWIDCTCTWTPPPGATADATAGTVLAVLNAIRPSPGPAPQRM